MTSHINPTLKRLSTVLKALAIVPARVILSLTALFVASSVPFAGIVFAIMALQGHLNGHDLVSLARILMAASI